MRFSERVGAQPARFEIQIDSIDESLRNGLWSSALMTFFSDEYGHRDTYSAASRRIVSFTRVAFLDFFKWPIDRSPDDHHRCVDVVRKWYFNANWFEVYDFIEASFEILNKLKRHQDANIFAELVNIQLERELSGYRFVDGHLVSITMQIEIDAVETAMTQEDKFAAVAEHLKSAISLFSDRKNPDHRNTIKESISAVEAVARIVSGNQKATLGEAIKAVETRHSIHPALKEGLLKIYGYTSDQGGIRHSLVDAPQVDASDAYFMLVSCSAFCNYLISKSVKK